MAYSRVQQQGCNLFQKEQNKTKKGKDIQSIQKIG